jgi:hydrogenase nickel incorporation protein HypA/HybF
MHELSIAQGIVEIVQQYTSPSANHRVKSVKLKIGEQAGIVSDSLAFCFSAITTQTPLEGALLDIERVPFTLHCNACQSDFKSETGIITCPQCYGVDTRVVAGTEMQVLEIEVADSEEEAS